MRICVPIPCFFGGMDFCEAMKKVGELGFDAVETYGWRGLDFDQIRKTTEETGVELLSMCTSEFRMTDPAYRQKWLDGLKESCEAANKAGATRLITQVGQDTGAPREEQHAAIVETLIQAKPILDAHKVSSRTPEFANTVSCTMRMRSRMSFAVALPMLTINPACFSLT